MLIIVIIICCIRRDRAGVVRTRYFQRVKIVLYYERNAADFAITVGSKNVFSPVRP